MALRPMARMGLLLDGIFVGDESTNIRLSTDRGKLVVMTLEGLAGFTFGGGQCTIDCGHILPRDGTAYPYQEKAASEDFVTAQVFAGPKSYTGTGQIMTHDVGQSTNASTEGSYQWVGELKPMQ